MIKIMLVDDEPIEREGLQLILRRNRSDFEIVAEARNGKEAIESALAYKPDLIFMDIKMPEFDGLEAIRQILAFHPAAKCVMVSAFDTFDYAREAMKYGIKEYLLKPSKISEVLQAYDRMAEEITKERQQTSERLEINQRLDRISSFVEAEYIVSLMMDHVHEFGEEDWNEWLDLEHTQGFSAVFSFESDNLQPGHEEKSEWHRILKQTLHQQELNCLVGPLTSFQVPVFVQLNTRTTETDPRPEFARSVIHHVQHKLEHSRLYAGIGTIVSDTTQFSRSYEESIQALESVYGHKGAAYMVYTEKVKKKLQESIPFEVEKELIEAVKKGDAQKGMQMFDSYFQIILKATDQKPTAIRKAIENFFIVMTREMKEFGYEGNVHITLTHLETSIQIKEAARVRLSEIFKEVGELRANGVKGLLSQAKEYLDSHYWKPVSLEEVAGQVGLSSYYLSKLFKEQFQITFSEYLTAIRLEKAKTYLLNGNVSLKEITFNIGYKDPNYFSRVFKKGTGLSPREYRNKYQQ